MTDFRLRNHDLLYADRGRKPPDWRNVAIFATIGFTVAFGVVSYLTDRFNAAGNGFSAASPGLVAQEKIMPSPFVHLATPEPSRSGS